MSKVKTILDVLGNQSTRTKQPNNKATTTTATTKQEQNKMQSQAAKVEASATAAVGAEAKTTVAFFDVVAVVVGGGVWVVPHAVLQPDVYFLVGVVARGCCNQGASCGWCCYPAGSAGPCRCHHQQE